MKVRDNGRARWLGHCLPHKSDLASFVTPNKEVGSLIRFMLRPSVVLSAVLAIGVCGAAWADTSAGAYLAGRQAARGSDFSAASGYFARALASDRKNSALLEATAQAFLSTGQVKRALPMALILQGEEIRSQIAHIVVTANLIEDEEYNALLTREGEDQGIGPLIDGLIKAWAHIGAGDVGAGLAEFDRIAEGGGLRGFAMYHKAMALAFMGDFEGAEAIFADPASGGVMMTRRGAMARAEILSQLQRNEDALSMLAEAFASSLDPGLERLAERLASGEQLPFTHVRSAKDGLAEVFFSIAAALRNEAGDDYTLLYARVAQFLRPDHIDGILLVAELLDALGQYELAVTAYKSVPANSPDFHAAELGRAEAMRRSGKADAAIEVLEQLAKSHPELHIVHSSLGDLFRQQEDYRSAVEAYDTALSLSEEGGRSRWFLLYARGISHERLDEWENAEADFRAALALNPDQPQVLNYLGYSLVEKQMKLDEALDMIERAVSARPDSGYIVDSLGWVLYRLGRYEEAVGHMERAVELMPVDPVVNDHLGDVYWAVGRYREADFQWRRALSFIDPGDTGSEADPDRIRRKLEVGLDVVLSEEGAPPLRAAEGTANDGG